MESTLKLAENVNFILPTAVNLQQNFGFNEDKYSFELLKKFFNSSKSRYFLYLKNCSGCVFKAVLFKIIFV
jgi:hypothetical protein